MAFYIHIRKLAEDEGIATYRFEGDERRTGSFNIDKRTGEVSLLESMPGDEGGHTFKRAAAKIMRAWKEGSLPETTEWAS